MRYFAIVSFAALLMTGCASSIKLDTAPVEDKAGVSVVAPKAVENMQSAERVQVNSGGVKSVDAVKPPAAITAPVIAKLVYFDYDSFVIRPEFQSLIEAHARTLKADKSRKVVIEGHTDERGGREYNLALGQKRSESVRQALGLLGVQDSQVEAVSFGKEKPAVQGSDEESMAKNRRAEISYR